MAKRRVKLTGVRWDPARLRKVATPFVRVAAGGVVLLSLGIVAARLAEVGRSDPRFLVVPSQLVSERLPRWMPPSVRDAIHQGVSQIAPLPIFEADFPERLEAGLLAATPWISGVREIERIYPNRARVELVLRQPRAAVDVGAWRYVLDERGVVLHRDARDKPTRFSTRILPVIGASITEAPAVGTLFGDDEVVSAAQVAGELMTLEEPWSGALRAVEPTALEVRRSIQGSVAAAGEVHIRTASGVLVEWGRARSSERHGRDELPVHRKIRHLQRILQRHPQLRGLEEVRLNFHDPYYRPVGGQLVFLREDDREAPSAK